MKFAPILFSIVTALGCVQTSAKTLIDSIDKKCKTSSMDKNQIDCTYKIGTNLEVVLVGVGDKDASIRFNKVSDDRFVVKFQMMPQCLMVGSSKDPENAFISPRSGKLFADWATCQNN